MTQFIASFIDDEVHEGGNRGHRGVGEGGGSNKGRGESSHVRWGVM